LQLNSLGNAEARRNYRDALVGYLESHLEALDEDSQRRLLTNPLRILDSKVADTRQILDEAPLMADFLDDESRADFDRLCKLLDAAGVPFVVNNRLVRGLDYYNKTVYEWVTERLGAQGTICGGGRYDGLVEQLGGKSTPAVGFAMGMERLVLMLQDSGSAATTGVGSTDVYAVAVGEAANRTALATVEAVRDALPQLTIVQHTGGGSFKSQLKRADKSGATVALIWGEDEVSSQSVTLKFLRDGSAQGDKSGQKTVPVEQLESTLQAAFAD